MCRDGGERGPKDGRGRDDLAVVVEGKLNEWGPAEVREDGRRSKVCPYIMKCLAVTKCSACAGAGRVCQRHVILMRALRSHPVADSAGRL